MIIVIDFSDGKGSVLNAAEIVVYNQLICFRKAPDRLVWSLDRIQDHDPILGHMFLDCLVFPAVRRLLQQGKIDELRFVRGILQLPALAQLDIHDRGGADGGLQGLVGGLFVIADLILVGVRLHRVAGNVGISLYSAEDKAVVVLRRDHRITVAVIVFLQKTNAIFIEEGPAAVKAEFRHRPLIHAPSFAAKSSVVIIGPLPFFIGTGSPS